ncbi:MAG: phosphonopyruvate decarboxylase, partial [Pseudohongiellaceae bacterium]
MTVSMDAFADSLLESGVDFFTGVPCSYLKSFVSFAAGSDRLSYTVAASEGEAIGLAAGAWMSGSLPMVLIQNSGLGNCVNPLTSLSHTYGLPLLLMVSHRARDGKDAPQHLLMGEKTYALIEAMGIQHVTLSDDEESACQTMAEAAIMAREGMCPVAIVVPKGTFEKYSFNEALAPKHVTPVAVSGSHAAELSPRVDALHAVNGALGPQDLLVATTGMTSRELFAVNDRPQNFYMMGSMGCALSIGLGVARLHPERKIVVLDGDGAFLMKLGTAA